MSTGVNVGDHYVADITDHCWRVDASGNIYCAYCEQQIIYGMHLEACSFGHFMLHHNALRGEKCDGWQIRHIW